MLQLHLSCLYHQHQFALNVPHHYEDFYQLFMVLVLKEPWIMCFDGLAQLMVRADSQSPGWSKLVSERYTRQLSSAATAEYLGLPTQPQCKFNTSSLKHSVIVQLEAHRIARG